MEDALTLVGTEAPRPQVVRYAIGPVSFEWIDGGLHAIRYGDAEMISAITFPVRDRDWGTLVPRLSALSEKRAEGALRLRWTATWSSGCATLTADLSVEAGPQGLTVLGRGRSDGAFETNRAGFTVLHPVGASGCPAVVEHSDGTETRGALPTLIEPWQPFMDIRALTHVRSGATIACRMEGDTFEMEDQRQWSDASFKTYNRPLAKPWPYRIAAGEVLEQSVTLTFSGPVPVARNASDIAVRVGVPTGTIVPELALVLDAAGAREADPGLLARIAPHRIACHAERGDDLSAFARLAALGARLDLDYAASCDGDLGAEFAELADQVASAGLDLASLFVCPSVDRRSTPPGSDWPDCPPLEQIHAAAARAFPDLPRGGGMLSYFTEFNRKRPPVGMLDFVAHGTNPIVHDAADRSVMQTLTAIPWILRSGKAIAGDVPYRLGLSSIPMRQNPYGSRVMENPDDGRICMAGSDPRHRARFGAAFTLGYLAAIAPFGVAVWTPAAGAGPAGVDGPGVDGADGLSPLGALLADLAPLAGRHVRKVEVTDPERVAALCAGDELWLANLTEAEIVVALGDRRLTVAPYGTLRVAASSS
ncbi:hypothetical protein [Wenxinia saemankumensis]|uniref:Uncharacterized protein n=1 Tax=Wenxinia saemankumensis TaxID=1447782 RepID=A0A1M5ZZ17_9RHOB|nr:hypothetical protein [Wenxinia saemankumensis]SHI29143.1 hypothetical protein SAMN05444417_0054 [Wenxinia saemankumensis]